MREDIRIGLFLILAAFLVYNLNLRVVGTGDSYATRVVPFALLTEGTLNLDDFRVVTVEGNPQPYWLQKTLDGHIASLFPIITPILVTPLYVPVVAYLKATGWTDNRLNLWAQIMEKVSASSITALAVGFMYLTIRRRASERISILLTLAFAFATGTWSTSSQALWLHGASELFLSLSLWLITGPSTPIRSVLAGFSIALIACNRPPDVFIAAAIGVPSILWASRRAALFLLSGLLVVVATIIYNVHTFGHLAGAWNGVGVQALSGNFPSGLAGLLFSPGRGLFVFAPFFLAIPFGLGIVLRDKSFGFLTRCLLIGIAAEIIFYSFTPFWPAGFSYGPRYMIDLFPAMIWIMTPIVEKLQGILRMSFVGVIIFSMWVEYIGAFHYTGESNVIYLQSADLRINATPFWISANTRFAGLRINATPFWIPANTQFILESKHPRQPPSLVTTIRNAL